MKYIYIICLFDAIFLLTVLSDLTDNINPIIRDNKFINLVFILLTNINYILEILYYYYYYYYLHH